MKRLKRTLCILSAVIFCMSAATGCGSSSSTAEQSSSAQASSSADENSKANDAQTLDTSTSAGESLEKTTETTQTTQDTKKTSSGSDEADLKSLSPTYVKVDLESGEVTEPSAVVTAYMDCFKNGDAKKLVELSGMGSYYELLAAAGEQEQKDPKEVEEQLEKIMKESCDSFEGYKLVGIYKVEGVQEQFNSFIAQFEKEMEESEDSLDEKQKEAAKKELEWMRKLLNFDQLLVYDMDITESGKTHEDQVYVLHNNSEGWKIEGVLMPSMLKYVKKSKITSANSVSKSISTAIQAAITDMDSEDLTVNQLQGTYTFSGSDFENLKMPESKQSKDDLKAILWYKVKQYFNDITKVDKIMFELDQNANLLGVAIQYGTYNDIRRGGEVVCYGTYPPLPSSGEETFNSLEEAFEYAKKRR